MSGTTVNQYGFNPNNLGEAELQDDDEHPIPSRELNFNEKALYCTMKVGSVALIIMGGFTLIQGLRILHSISAPFITGRFVQGPYSNLVKDVQMIAMQFLVSITDFYSNPISLGSFGAVALTGALTAVMVGTCVAIPVSGAVLCYQGRRLWSYADEWAAEKRKSSYDEAFFAE